MSWTDKQSIKVIKYLRDKYKINTFVETGTFKGINARLHSSNFKRVMTCEKIHGYYQQAKNNMEIVEKKYRNVILVNEESPKFLKHLVLKQYIFYLDAHFYDKDLPAGEEQFVVLKELENMKKFKNSIIIIHDFDNGLGHLTYDGIKLDMDLVRDRLLHINPKFKFYTNRLEGCNPVKPEAKDIIECGLIVDADTLDNINYAWLSPRLTYRGFLYCLPSELTKNELKELGLRKWS